MWCPEGVEKEKGDVARKKRGNHICHTVAGLWLTKIRKQLKKEELKNKQKQVCVIYLKLSSQTDTK